MPAEKELNGQARPNVLIEAGMALGKDSARTMVVQVGEVRPASDILGRHVVKLNNAPECRHSLAQRLKQAGCKVNTKGEAWLSKGDFSLQAFSPAGLVPVYPGTNSDMQSATDLERIGVIVSEALIDKLGPLFDGFTKKVVDIFPYPPPSAPFKSGEPTISTDLEERIQAVRQSVHQGTFEGAEEDLKDLAAKHPKSLNVLEEFYALYTNPDYPDKKSGVLRLLELLRVSKAHFRNNERYFRLIALAHMAYKGFGYDIEAKKNALEAAQTCIRLDGMNASWDALLAMVYYWFGNTTKAIEISKEGLTKAQQKGDEQNTNITKNNLAFFYATELDADNKETATKYGKEALEWFGKGNDEHALANGFDTLGFVKMRYASNREELQEARRLFMEARKYAPRDQGINDHLHEVTTILCG